MVRVLDRRRQRLGEIALHLTATTTGAAESVTIARMALNVPGAIYWGDGTATALAAGDTASKSHTYAVSGTYNVVVPRAIHITNIDIRTAQIGGLNTAELRYSPIVYFWLTLATGCTIASADMAAWTPTTWLLFAMPAGTYTIASADMVAWTPTDWQMFWMPAGTYTIDSAHMAAWTPTYWRLTSMPAGTYSIDSADMAAWTPTGWWLFAMPAGTYTIASADMVAWTPTDWRLYSMPAAGSSYTFAAAIMRNWTTVTQILMNDLNLLTAAVDTIIEDIWAGRMGYGAGDKSLNVGGTNQVPTGAVQAPDPCPPANVGEEIWELAKDSCGGGHNKWTVTYNGGSVAP